MPSERRRTKQRLDLAMVERGLAPTQDKARAFILAGDVEVAGNVETRAVAQVSADAPIEVTRGPRFVSRGGDKLEHAVDVFALETSGRVAVDVGASTGGFTDCLLQHGARRVYAIDAGYGQLDSRLRNDPRVVVMERTNIRNLQSLPEAPDMATVDASFISLTVVLPVVRRVVRPGGDVLALVKPQFEARRDEVKRDGVVRDPLVQASVIGRVAWWCVNGGFRVRGVVASPLLGAKGNREFFLWLRTPDDDGEPSDQTPAGSAIECARADAPSNARRRNSPSPSSDSSGLYARA